MNDIAARQDHAIFIKDKDFMKLKRAEAKVFSMVNTPSPRTKCYVLAATSTKNASTQTPTNSEDDMVGMTRDAAAAENDKNKKTTMFSEDLKAALSEAKNTILEVLQEKEV